MKRNTDISIITVNYNGIKDTLELIESLNQYIRSVIIEIIVVDNASKQDEAALVAARYPDVITIRSEKNLGFAGGNNLGIKQATGRFIFLLNNDTYVRSDTFQYLIERLESLPEIGVVSPKIRFVSEGNPIQFAGYTQLSTITLRNNLIGFGEEDKGQYQQAYETNYAHGAAMILKREAIEKAGLMPECFFLYYEELDWCERIKEAGFTIWYEPRCEIFHKESQSTGQRSPLRTYYLTRNRLLYAKRNRKGLSRLLSYQYQLLMAFPKNLLVDALNRRLDLCKAQVNGVKDFITKKYTL